MVSSGGLRVASSPTYSNRKPNSFCNTHDSLSLDHNESGLKLATEPNVQKYGACFMLYLQFELVSNSQARVAAFLSPGQDEALVVRGVAPEQIFQVIIALWHYQSKIRR